MKKIYKEHFTFDRQELRKSFFAFLLKNSKDCDNCLTKEELCNKLGKMLRISSEVVYEHIFGSDTPDSIATVYAYGEILGDGNRYAFLKPLKANVAFGENAKDMQVCDSLAKDGVKAIYSALINVVSEYSASDGFNIAPDGSDAQLYYYHKIGAIEDLICRFAYEDAIGMLHVTRSIKEMIRTHDFPGVPNRWYGINPNLRFYTVGFSLIVDAPDFYEKLKNRETWMSLEYYPEESEMELCYEYFAALYKESEENNCHYNVDDFFQQELINTIKIIFERYINHRFE
jgi:hypothetical protein